jgi:beta-glucanase (GH16 family)
MNSLQPVRIIDTHRSRRISDATSSRLAIANNVFIFKQRGPKVVEQAGLTCSSDSSVSFRRFAQAACPDLREGHFAAICARGEVPYRIERIEMRDRLCTQSSLFVLATIVLVVCGGTLRAQSKVLVWSDEFNETAIDLTRWRLGQGTSNDNLQYYTGRPENAQISGGMLQIIARKESYAGMNYTSALLQTQHAVYWRYGRMEARIKLPGSPGFVPAFWMLPEDDRYGWWPYSGEIDVMEYPTTQGGTVYGTAHSQAHSSFTGTAPLGSTIAVGDAESAFHVYAIEWSPQQVDFFVDANKYFTVVNERTGHAGWPFDQPFFAILNLAVGGGWVGTPTASTMFPAVMLVDYVRVYQLPGDIGMAGRDFVAPQAQAGIYSLPQVAGATYAWAVPPTAQIVSGQGTSAITVNWGSIAGDISAIVNTLSGPVTCTFRVEVSKNLLKNGGFEKGVKYWKGSMASAANGSFALDTSTVSHTGQSIRAVVVGVLANPWDAQISQPGFTLDAGKQYEVSLWARSAIAGAKLNAAVINTLTYALFGSLSCTLSRTWTRFSFQFTAGQSAAASLNLDLGVQPATYFCDDISVVKLENGTGTAECDDRTHPGEFFLGQNYPNPFNPSTAIRYGLPNRNHVTLTVFTALGQEVAVLQDGAQAAGYYEVRFDARAQSSGVYFYRMQAGAYAETRRLLLVR